MRSLKVVIPLVVLALLVGCAKPPTADINAAQAALQTAEQNPDVTTYAPDQLKAAQDKLAQLQSELDLQAKKGALSRNYDAAKNLALETTAAADALSSEAEAAKQVAKNNAAAAIDELTKTLIPQAQSGIAMARRVRGIKLDFAALTAALNQARTQTAEAQTAYNNGDYATALSTADAVKSALAQESTQVADAISAARTAK
jgi:hypothetical protein